MSLITRFSGIFRNLLRKDRIERDLAEEVESYLQTLIEEKVAAGMSPDQVRRASRIELGGVEQVKEQVRQVRGGIGLESLGQDVRFGLRLVRRNPGFALAIILVMSLGIGSNTAVFSVINTVLLRPLPYAESDRLVLLWERRPQRGIERNVVSGHEFPEWKERNRVFESMAAVTFSGSEFNLTGAGEPALVMGARVSADFFGVLKAPPVLGRDFLPEEDVPGSERVVIPSHELWQNRFGSDQGLIGRMITLNDIGHTVVGVMPPGFHFSLNLGRMESPRLWVPIAEPLRHFRGRHFLVVVARLNPGVSLERAQADMRGIALQLERENHGLNTDHGINVVPLHADLVNDVSTALLVLMAAVAFVLLIACANVAGLLLARASARRREIAVRTALGASRLRLARQLLTESVLLSILGGGLGLALAHWIIDILPAISPVAIPRMAELRVDRFVLGVAVVVSVFTGLIFGVVPAFQASRMRAEEWLKEGTWSSAGLERQRLRKVLVVSEVALALLLLVGAGLMARSFMNLTSVRPGFDSGNVLVLDLALPQARYREAWQQVAFFEQLFGRLGSLPGVQAVGGSNALPLGAAHGSIGLSIEGRPDSAPGDEPSAEFRVVTREYFKAMNIPLVRGRHFEKSDARVALPLIRWFERQPLPPRFGEPQAPPVAIINEAMAGRFWPGQDPVGRRIRVLFSPWITVVGVVGDIRHLALSSEPKPELYLSDMQEPQRLLGVVVHTTGDPMNLVSALRQHVWALDNSLPAPGFGPWKRWFPLPLVNRALRLFCWECSPSLPCSSCRWASTV